MKFRNYFYQIEGKIRNRLSHHPLVYALIGSVGIVLIWRGIWHLADNINMPAWISLVLGILIAAVSGLFVSFFVGENILISGMRKEKRVDQKTEEEIIKEEEEIEKEEKIVEEIEKDIKEIKEELSDIKKTH